MTAQQAKPQAPTTVDFKTEVKNIDKLRKNFDAQIDNARNMARTYSLYTIESGNSDLLRHLRDAIPVDMKPRLDKWIKSTIPYKVKRKTMVDAKGNPVLDPETGKKQNTYSYVKDKVVEAEKGLAIFNQEAFQANFDRFKPTPEDKGEETFAEAAKAFLRKLELLGEKATELSEQHAAFGDVADAMAKHYKAIATMLSVEAEGVEAPDVKEETRKRQALQPAAKVVEIDAA